MCEVPTTSGSGDSSSKGAVAVAVVLGASVVAYACAPSDTPTAKTAAPPAHAGLPWLTISVTALATLAAAALVITVVLAIRRRRAAARAAEARHAAMVWPPAMRRRAPQRAIEAAPVPAQAWLDGRTEVKR